MDVKFMDFVDAETGEIDVDSMRPEFGNILGEEHKETKTMDDVPDVGILLKNYVNTKRDYGRKLDNVIQKPAEDADDEAKAEYRSTLLKELGVPDKVEGYELIKPQLPDGMDFDDGLLKQWGQIFLEGKVPKSIANFLYNKFNEIAVKRHETMMKAEKQAFDKGVEYIKNLWLGDKLKENLRNAHTFLMEFGTDDVKDANDKVIEKGLKTLLTESKIIDELDNFEKWLSLGIDPMQLITNAKIGKAMEGGKVIPSTSIPGGDTPKDDIQKLGEQLYDHEDSQRQLLGKK